MLVVTIEVWPWGRAELKRKVGEITAGNIAGSGPIGTYEIRVHQEEYREAGVAEISEELILRDHDRRAGPLALIRDALILAIPRDTESRSDDDR
jgi:hypothetical protein